MLGGNPREVVMTLKLNMLPPSVNNMSVRVFVRAAGLPYEEENVWGQTQSDEYRAKVPSGLTPSIEPANRKDPLEGIEVIPVDVSQLLDKQKEWSDRYEALLSRSDKVGG